MALDRVAGAGVTSTPEDLTPLAGLPALRAEIRKATVWR